jgi:hypothetical protein
MEGSRSEYARARRGTDARIFVDDDVHHSGGNVGVGEGRGALDGALVSPGVAANRTDAFRIDRGPAVGVHRAVLRQDGRADLVGRCAGPLALDRAEQRGPDEKGDAESQPCAIWRLHRVEHSDTSITIFLVCFRSSTAVTYVVSPLEVKGIPDELPMTPRGATLRQPVSQVRGASRGLRHEASHAAARVIYQCVCSGVGAVRGSAGTALAAGHRAR